MLRIDSAQQLALVKAEAERVIGLPSARLPRRLLAGQNDRQSVEVGEHGRVDRLVERKEACLMGK